ncbi:PDR/VanB family oxidoreductase [Nocardioides sambongensis]|uniref:PDR/VanB family oxidoreductase n=1 Tax=Nocardioides sambongensis TaxID=2589074 RepID=UPI00112AA926|nr:PDR/VanB family oxidoreductase [Nocardioides sambongensis]
MIATLKLVVTAVEDAARDIRTVTLATPDGGELPSFVPGSHLVVECEGPANAYSLVSDGVLPEHYRISVLRVPDGAGGSRWIHDLGVGDTVSALPPRSAFAPVATATKHLLIAGGIGVTPMLSHLHAARRWGRRVQLLYAFRDGYGAHVADVEELVAALPGGCVELLSDRAALLGRLGEVLGTQPLGTHLYVCGPGAMIDAVLAAAQAGGWPASRLHAERFGVDALDPGEPFSVTLTGSGSTVDVPSGVSLLDALDGAGVAVPRLCRQGVCGECRIPVTAGTPLHRDLFLTDEERRAGDAVMACVSRSLGPTLEVPL